MSVSELLGTKIAGENITSDVAEQLSRINEQLSIKNSRSRRIWIILAIIFVVGILLYVLGIATFFGTQNIDSNSQNNYPATTDEAIMTDE